MLHQTGTTTLDGAIYTTTLAVDQLIETRDHPKVRPALAARLPLWLGRWSRKAQTVAQGNEQSNWRTARLDRITAALAVLSSDETNLFNKLCVEVNDLTVLPLDRACSSKSVQPLLRTRLVMLEGEKRGSTPLAYRCEKGHVFLLDPPEQEESSIGSG